MSEPITVEYELDQWEWQGTTRTIEVDPDDYQGMSKDKIRDKIYAEVKRDAIQNLHLVVEELDSLAQEVLDACAAAEAEDEEAA